MVRKTDENTNDFEEEQSDDEYENEFYIDNEGIDDEVDEDGQIINKNLGNKDENEFDEEAEQEISEKVDRELEKFSRPSKGNVTYDGIYITLKKATKYETVHGTGSLALNIEEPEFLVPEKIVKDSGSTDSVHIAKHWMNVTTVGSKAPKLPITLIRQLPSGDRCRIQLENLISYEAAYTYSGKYPM